MNPLDRIIEGYALIANYVAANTQKKIARQSCEGYIHYTVEYEDRSFQLFQWTDGGVLGAGPIFTPIN